MDTVRDVCETGTESSGCLNQGSRADEFLLDMGESMHLLFSLPPEPQPAPARPSKSSFSCLTDNIEGSDVSKRIWDDMVARAEAKRGNKRQNHDVENLITKMDECKIGKKSKMMGID